MIENFPLLFILSKIEELMQCIPLKANSLKSLFDSAILVSPEFLFIQPFKTISELKKSFREEFLDLMFENNILGFQHEAKLIDVGRPESVIEAEKYFK
jgi:NDP-sugar pyrophosphorylase family protein